MADSADFTPDQSRWAITAADVKAGNLTDPASGLKDVGWQVGQSHVSAYENSLRANAYLMLKWLDEDYGPGITPWGGLLGSEADGAGLVIDSATNFAVDVAAGRWQWQGKTYTIAETLALTYPTSVITTRYDYVVVDIDPVARTAAYAIVPGVTDNTFPALGADQFPIAALEVANGPGGQNPSAIRDLRFRPGRPRPQTETLRFSGADFNRIALVAADYTFDEDEGSILLADGSPIVIPVELDVGDVVEAVRMHGLKNAPSAASDGNTAILRRRQLGGLSAVPVPTAMVVWGSDAEPLSATPFVVSSTTIAEPVVIENHAYEIIFTHVNSATALANRARVWGFEIDVRKR